MRSQQALQRGCKVCNEFEAWNENLRLNSGLKFSEKLQNYFELWVQWYAPHLHG